MKTAHAIILVAGEGRRLLPFTLNNPKCFAEINDMTILENALIQFSRHGVQKAIIVVGHLKENVINRIGSSYQGVSIEYVVNGDYQITNSMFSLLLALRKCDEPAWVLEGDVFFDGTILDLPFKGDFSWFGDSSIRDLDGAYLGTDAESRVVSLDIIRDLELLRAGHHKSVGLLHLTSEGLRTMRQWLDTAVGEGKTNLYYDLIAVEHLEDYPIYLVDVKGNRWFEIDTNEDLVRARKLFAA